jgi:putative intracellular protease/amidase
MATQESNIIMFSKSIDPEDTIRMDVAQDVPKAAQNAPPKSKPEPPPKSKRKEGVRIAEQFLEKIDGLIMKGLRRELAAAEARVLVGSAGAAGDAEFLFLSIGRRLRDRDAIGREVMEICARAAALDF